MNGGGRTGFGFRDSLLAETPGMGRGARSGRRPRAPLPIGGRLAAATRPARRAPDLAAPLLERAERARPAQRLSAPSGPDLAAAPRSITVVMPRAARSGARRRTSLRPVARAAAPIAAAQVGRSRAGRRSARRARRHRPSGTRKPVPPSTIASGMPAMVASRPPAAPTAAASARTVGSPSASPSRAVTLGAASSQARAHPAGDLVLGERAEEADGVAEAERRRCGAPAPAAAARRRRPPAVRPGSAFAPARRRRSSSRGALLLDQPADMEDQAGLGVAAGRPEAVEVDADIMGDACARPESRRATAWRRTASETARNRSPCAHQPPPEQGIAHPGQPARSQHPRARAADVIAVQGRDQRHAEGPRERQGEQAVGREMGVDQPR